MNVIHRLQAHQRGQRGHPKGVRAISDQVYGDSHGVGPDGLQSELGQTVSAQQQTPTARVQTGRDWELRCSPPGRELRGMGRCGLRSEVGGLHIRSQHPLTERRGLGGEKLPLQLPATELHGMEVFGLRLGREPTPLQRQPTE